MKKTIILRIIALVMFIFFAFVGCTKNGNDGINNSNSEDVGATENEAAPTPSTDLDFDVAATYEYGTIYATIVIYNNTADVIEVRQHILMEYSDGTGWMMVATDGGQPNLPIIVQPGTTSEDIEFSFSLNRLPSNQIESFRLNILGESGVTILMKYEFRLVEDNSGNVVIEEIEKTTESLE
jgi:hypothetical protein